MSPEQAYRALLAQEDFTADPAQARVVALLEALYRRLDQRATRRPGLVGRLAAFGQIGDRSGFELGLSATDGTNNVAAATHTTERTRGALPTGRGESRT